MNGPSADAGGSTYQRLLKASLDPMNLRGILLTHSHCDHINGLPGLLFALKLSGFQQQLSIYGNAPTLELAQRILEVFNLEGYHADVDWVTGACLLTYRTDLEAVGFMDERFFLYLEDVDLCASIRARGRRVLFVADVEVVHHRGASAEPAARATAYRQSYLAFYQKHHPAWVPLVRAYMRLFARQ